MGLRLIPSAHDAEADAQVIALHERGNHRLQRPFARLDAFGCAAVKGEKSAAALQANPAPSGTTQEPKFAKTLWMSEATLPAASTAQRYVVSPPCAGSVPAAASTAASSGIDEGRAFACVAFDSIASRGIDWRSADRDVTLQVRKRELLRFDHRVQRLGAPNP